MPASLRGVSRDSQAQVREHIDEVLVADTPAELVDRISGELFAVVDLLDAQPAVRRVLTDPSRDGTDRAGFVEGLLGGKVADQTLMLVAGAVKLQWSRTRDLGDALEYLAVLAAVREADQRSALDAVEDQLFSFAEAIEDNPRLAAALSDPAAPVPNRVRLATDLLEGRADRVSIALIERAVAAPRAGTVPETVGDFADVAAALRQRLVATVRTATPLSDSRRDRLRATLSRQYHRDVHVNVLVEPDVVGGLSITLGDDLIDGTMQTRLSDARRRLAG
jgi:F-type H+-transporting ATPase subunit delta